MNTKSKRKPPTFKSIDIVINEQIKFIEQVTLTLKFLKIYRGNPKDFSLLFSQEVKGLFKFDECQDNPEYIWETIDELTYEMIYGIIGLGDKSFTIKQNGLFPVLHFSKKKNKNIVEEINEQFEPFTHGKWKI